MVCVCVVIRNCIAPAVRGDPDGASDCGHMDLTADCFQTGNGARSGMAISVFGAA